MKEFLNDNYVTIIVVAFYVVEILTCTIALWETFTGKSIVDVIWDMIITENDNIEMTGDED